MRWKWIWDVKAAEVYLIVKFVAFGPFMLLIHSNQNLVDVADNPGDLASSYENLAIADLYNGYVIKKCKEKIGA